MICIKGSRYSREEWYALEQSMRDALIHLRTNASCDGNCVTCTSRRICLDLDEAASYSEHMWSRGTERLKKEEK